MSLKNLDQIGFFGMSVDMSRLRALYISCKDGKDKQGVIRYGVEFAIDFLMDPVDFINRLDHLLMET